MSTVRVNLSLPPEVVKVLDRIGAATGTGRSTVVREWLIEGLPLFLQMADALEQVKAGNRDPLQLMAQSLQAAAVEARGISRDLLKPNRLGQRAPRVKGAKS